MKSSSGEYYIGLDHVRAIAAYLVFTWHFIYGLYGQQAGDDAPAAILFPLSLLGEGHTGVALFMTLSGYLFAKLLHRKNISYVPFIWNRCLRLIPLLAFVVFVVFVVGFLQYLEGGDILGYARSIAAGIAKPSLPNGGWSITVEFHFYLLLPLLLLLSRKSNYSLVLIVLAAVLIRALVYHKSGQVHTISYLTIVGRIDQFVLGMMGYLGFADMHFRPVQRG